jgi:hypothetical protein
MKTMMSASIANPPARNGQLESESTSILSSDSDPFNGGAVTEKARSTHRFSSFDTQLFAQYQATSSPLQVKKALEAHLQETDRRLEEASRLGTSLVQQRKELTDSLKEVEKRQGEGEIGPELRQKLADVEREYNELGRDTARASLLAKPRGLGSDSDATNAFAVCPIFTTGMDIADFILEPSKPNQVL